MKPKLYEVQIAGPFSVNPVYVIADNWDEAARKAIDLDLKPGGGEATNGGVSAIRLLGIAPDTE